MLDDLKGIVDQGGFGKGFHEGNVSLMVVDDLEQYAQTLHPQA